MRRLTIARALIACFVTAQVFESVAAAQNPYPSPSPEPTHYVSTLPPTGTGGGTESCFCASDSGQILCNQDPSIEWTWGPSPICPQDPADCPDHAVSGTHGSACVGYQYQPSLGSCGDWIAVPGKIYCLGHGVN